MEGEGGENGRDISQNKLIWSKQKVSLCVKPKEYGVALVIFYKMLAPQTIMTTLDHFTDPKEWLNLHV